MMEIHLLDFVGLKIRFLPLCRLCNVYNSISFDINPPELNEKRIVKWLSIVD